MDTKTNTQALAKPARRRLHAIACAVAAIALALVLSGCTLQPASKSADENAAANRQYMAQLNQRSDQLAEAMTKFQTAAGTGDSVGMKAAADEAAKVVEQVKSTEATEALAEVKEIYVAGLEQLDDAMGSYVDLYTQMEAGSVSQSAFERKVKAIQGDYDRAVERIASADEELTKLANE